MTRCPSKGAYLFLITLLLTPHLVIAQETLLERLSEQEAENNPQAEDALQELLTHPLEVNRLTRQDLLRLPFLSVEQIDAFLAQRNKNDGFRNLDEALATLAVAGDTLKLCQQLFFFSPPKEVDRLKAVARWRITYPATIDEDWLGTSYRSYERAMLSAGEFSLGALAERDPGEQRLDDHGLLYGRWQQGTADAGWQVLAGNYQLEWAQGLAFWGPYATTVSADVHAAARRQGRGLLPYLAGDENAALRGAGFLFNRQFFALLAFASSQRLNATLRNDTTVVNFSDDGYHRTTSELTHRKTLHEKIIGAGIRLSWRNRLELGLLAYQSEYDKNWDRPNLEYGHFRFVGRANNMIGLALRWKTSQLETNLEMARSRSGGVAGSAVIFGGEPRLKWTVEMHHCARDFHSPHGRGANAISDPPQNEFGYSLGLSSRLRRGLITEIFIAQSQNFWRTASLSLPGSELAAGVKLDWRVHRDITVQARWQQSRDDDPLATVVVPGLSESQPVLDDISYEPNTGLVERVLLVPQWRESGRLKLEYQVTSKLRLTSRFDFAWRPRLKAAHLRGTAGDPHQIIAKEERDYSKLATALSQELRWTVLRRLQITGRYVLFDTPPSTAIYQYEHDLPGMFTNFALRERGRRWYIYVRSFIALGIELSFKLACTEREVSLFERARSYSQGLQLDWRLPIGL